jgi:hypothetical protein
MMMLRRTAQTTLELSAERESVLGSPLCMLTQELLRASARQRTAKEVRIGGASPSWSSENQRSRISGERYGIQNLVVCPPAAQWSNQCHVSRQPRKKNCTPLLTLSDVDRIDVPYHQPSSAHVGQARKQHRLKPLKSHSVGCAHSSRPCRCSCPCLSSCSSQRPRTAASADWSASHRRPPPGAPHRPFYEAPP